MSKPPKYFIQILTMDNEARSVPKTVKSSTRRYLINIGMLENRLFRGALAFAKKIFPESLF